MFVSLVKSIPNNLPHTSAKLKQIEARFPDPTFIFMNRNATQVQIQDLSLQTDVYSDVSENSGTPKSSVLIGFSNYKPSILGYHYFWKHLFVDVEKVRQSGITGGSCAAVECCTWQTSL